MINKVFEYSKKPKLYAQSTSKFWDDKHISKMMLKAHLNPTLEAASRKHDFIDKSVKWIETIAPRQRYNKVLDLGCGPGMYTHRLANKGYKVTGIDFSKRSIGYAKNKAEKQGYNIEYIYKNYLEIEYSSEFDVILLIYCDYAVLTHDQRKALLGKIYTAMKKGAKFIFDVFTPKQYEDDEETHNWYLEESGFWRPQKHICLESNYIYDDNIRLNQYIVLDKEGNVNAYRIWHRYYTEKMIRKELEESGFVKTQIYSDVTGKPYCNDSKTICIVAEK